MRNMRLAAALVAAGLASGVSISVAAQKAHTFTVDCSRGYTITKALENGDARKPLVLLVRGTCNESVTIARDDVTLQGDPGIGGLVNGPEAGGNAITIMANRVTIDSLTVTGAGNGIAVQGALNAVLTNNLIQNTAQDGILVVVGHGRIVGNTIQSAGNHGVSMQGGNMLLGNNQIRQNRVAGVHLEGSATAIASDNTITQNGSNGIELRTNSQGTMTNNTITGNGTQPPSEPGSAGGIHARHSRANIFDGNRIADNTGTGVGGFTATIEVAGSNTITRNQQGVVASLGATLDLRGGTISGNLINGVVASWHSTARIAGAAIHDNAANGIRIANGSALLLGVPVTDASGNTGWGLECGDAESSVLGSLNGTVSPTCTGF